MLSFSFRKKIAVVLVLFPALMMLAFAMHLRSIHAFFDLKLVRPPYDGGKFFDTLVAGAGHGFIMAHSVALFTVPLFMVVTIVLAGFLYAKNPLLAATGAIIGLIGNTGLAAVFGAWLTFTDIRGLAPQYYAGARPGFIELVKMKGMLKFISETSYLAFIGLAVLAAGLAWARQFKPVYMLSIIAGATLFVLFMDMDNWMFIGSGLLLVGLTPVVKQLYA